MKLTLEFLDELAKGLDQRLTPEGLDWLGPWIEGHRKTLLTEELASLGEDRATKINVTLAKDEKLEIDASLVSEFFAVHRSRNCYDPKQLGTGWAVTHVPTGLHVATQLKNRTLARSLAVTLGTLPVDWSVTDRDRVLSQQPRAVSQTVREICSRAASLGEAPTIEGVKAMLVHAQEQLKRYGQA